MIDKHKDELVALIDCDRTWAAMREAVERIVAERDRLRSLIDAAYDREIAALVRSDTAENQVAALRELLQGLCDEWSTQYPEMGTLIADARAFLDEAKR